MGTTEKACLCGESVTVESWNIGIGTEQKVNTKWSVRLVEANTYIKQDIG